MRVTVFIWRQMCLFPAVLFLLIPFGFSKEKWRIGELGDIQIYSNASPLQTQETVADLIQVQKTLSRVFPNLAAKTDGKKLRVVLCKDSPTIKRFTGLYNGKPRESGGMFTRDYQGDLMLINAGGDFDQTRSAVYHEYIHFLAANRSFYMPPWLGEGIAETFSTIEFSKRGAKVGLTEAYNSRRLVENKLIPLERFFQVTHGSPEYNSSNHGRGVFYAQSWGFVHFMMFGNHILPKDGFKKLIDATINSKRIDEEMFKSFFGIDFDEMEDLLRRYVRRGRYTYNIYPIEKEEESKLELRMASNGEVELVHGMILLKTREPLDAYPYLARAYKSLPDSPMATAYQGYYCIKQDLFEEAEKYFAEAIAKGSTSGATYLYHAVSYLFMKDPSRRMREDLYDKDETVVMLRSLFKARELGESRELMYQSIGQVWICSKMTAKEGHVGAVLEGFKLYPTDPFLQYCLATLYYRIGRLGDAAVLVEIGLANSKVGRIRNGFEALREEIARPK